MLSAEIIRRIRSFMDEGDVQLDAEDFSGAVSRYEQAAALIPEPKEAFEVALEVFGAMGEAYFFAGDYRKSVPLFQFTQKCPGGAQNPHVHLRTGQALLELGELDAAAMELTTAHMLGGPAILEGEDEKYATFLASRIKM